MHVMLTAAADEKIKEQTLGQTQSIDQQAKFTTAVNEIESSVFVPSTFKSNRSVCWICYHTRTVSNERQFEYLA